MKVRDIMTQPVRTCRAGDTLNAAARVMWDHDCGAVPVVDDDGRLVGIVTDRDACIAAYTQGRPLHAIPVTIAMAKTIFACVPEDTVEAAERVMAERRVRRLPIVDESHRPIGIVTLTDLARRAAPMRLKGSQDRRVLETLAAVCAPRRAPTGTEAKAPPPA